MFTEKLKLLCSSMILLIIISQYNVISTEETNSHAPMFEPPWNGCKHRSRTHLVCDFIPFDVPVDTETVTLLNVDYNDYGGDTLRAGHFLSPDWGRITRLEIIADPEWTGESFQMYDSFCFQGLHELKELHISLKNPVNFTSKTFATLGNVSLLDFRGCRRLPVDSIVTAIRGPNILPRFQALNLSMINSFTDGISLENDFFKAIHDKNVKELDVSFTQINHINVTSLAFYCNYLVLLNFSSVDIHDFYINDDVSLTCPNLRIADFSYITLPTSVIPSYSQRTVFVRNESVPIFLTWSIFNVFSNVEYFDLSGIIAKHTTYVLENVKALVLGADRLHTKTVIIRNNYFERLDLSITMPNSPIEHLDISNCMIQFINPHAISSSTALKVLIMANNNLSKMAIENFNLFGKLYKELKSLRVISLAGNQLREIPENMFSSSGELERLDLSNNRIEQVTFDLKSQKQLKLLDLKMNLIKILNSASLAKINAWLSMKSQNRTEPHSIDFRQNQLSCAECKSRPFVQWMMKSRVAIQNMTKTKCLNSKNQAVDIDESTLRNIESVCNRPKVIMGACFISVFIIVVAIVTLLRFRTYRRQRQRRLDMEDRIRLIREGAEDHEFVVFLSYSSNDDEFIQNYVLQHLNENLQQAVGNDRELVCEGDRYFQLGRPIHDQISCLLKRAAVVVAVLSDNYCRSVHCRNEFDLAFMLQKPVVLMVKGQVNVELMTPLIRDIYDTNTRIHWAEENGEYVLKTSWENICSSILELVKI